MPMTPEELAETLAQRYTLEEVANLRPGEIHREYGVKLNVFMEGRRLALQQLRQFKGSIEELAELLRARIAVGEFSALDATVVAKEFGVELSFAKGATATAAPRPPQPEPEQHEQEQDEPDSWTPIDLGPYLRGEIVRPTPSVGLARADGLRMLYPGKEHAVIGEMESGKSWFSLASVQAELEAGNTVLYFHFEEADPSDTIERLQVLGVPDDDIEKRFRFIAPQRQVSGDALGKLLTETPTLVVFDGVNEAMSLHGWGIRDEDGAAQFRRQLVMPCIRAGAATLSCDHVVKDKESRGRNALGSIHKGNGISGSLILLENSEPFGRGQQGASRVYVTKDRPGHLRRHGRADKMPGKTFMGMLSVDATIEPLQLRFWAPREDDAAQSDLSIRQQVQAAVQALQDEDLKATVDNIRVKVGMRKQTVTDVLTQLVVDKTLIERKEGNSRVFSFPADTP